MKILPQQLQIELEKVNFVYDHIVTGGFLNVLVGAVLCVVMQDVLGVDYIVIWYVVLILAVLLRFFILFLYRRGKDKIGKLQGWRIAFVLGVFLTGSVWGGGGILLFPPDDVARQIFLDFIIGGIVMGSVPYFAPLTLACFSFLLSAELPITIYLFSFGDALHVMVGVVNILFVVTMLVAARMYQGNFLQNLMLRFVNQDLVKKLNTSNAELEQKIKLKNKIEQNLRENEHRFKALSNAAHDGVIIHKNGIIIEANEAVARMLGISIKELINMSVLEFITPRFRDEIINHLVDTTDEECETTLQCKDGSLFQAEINSGDIIYQGTLASIVSIRDISKQKQIASDLLHAKNVAEEADKLKSEFLASVSHELRTPLNAMIGFLQIVDETALTSEQHKYLEMGEKSAKQLLLLINDLLDLSRIETGNLEYHLQAVEMKEFLEETIQVMTVKARERDNDLQLAIMGILPERVNIDPDRVRQVLTNLLGNAIKFTEAGNVSLTVSVEQSAQGEKLLRFEVKDSGIGIPNDRQHLIFSRFTQLDASISRNYGGVGLGLAICLELVNKMGGDIGVISQPGQGAVFWFTLPYEVVETPAQVGHIRDQAGITTDRVDDLSVLVVEDEESNQIIARHILEKLGCSVDVLDNGQQAVDCAKSYDLIFMDMQMPVLNGLAATEQLRSMGVKTPIIAMTANAMQGDRERCLQAGMDDYVSKPIERAKLLQVIIHWGQDKKKSASG